MAPSKKNLTCVVCGHESRTRYAALQHTNCQNCMSCFDSLRELAAHVVQGNCVDEGTMHTQPGRQQLANERAASNPGYDTNASFFNPNNMVDFPLMKTEGIQKSAADGVEQDVDEEETEESSDSGDNDGLEDQRTFSSSHSKDRKEHEIQDASSNKNREPMLFNYKRKTKTSTSTSHTARHSHNTKESNPQQQKYTNHSYSSISKGGASKSPEPRVNDNCEPVYCTCAGPDTGEGMGACSNDKCDTPDEWYHYSCVNIEEQPAEEDLWYCPGCQTAGRL